MLDCGRSGSEHVVVEVRSPPVPAARQPRAYTLAGTKARAWSTAAVVPLLLYFCRTAAVLLVYCETKQLLLKTDIHRYF